MKQLNLNFTLLFFALLILGIGVTLYQHFELGLSFSPHQQNHIWKIDAKVKVSTNDVKKPLRINLFIPNLQNDAILSEAITAKGFGKAITDDENNRIAVLSLSDPGEENSVIYSLLVDSGTQINQLKQPNVKKEQENIKRSQNTEQSEQQEKILYLIQQQSADNETLTKQSIQFVNDPAHEADIRRLLGDNFSPSDQYNLTQELLTQAGLPTVLLHAVPYKNDLNINISTIPTWVAAFYDNDWHLFDAQTSKKIHDPNASLIWWTGNQPLFTADNGSSKLIQLSTQAQSISQEKFLDLKYSHVANTLYSYSLASLPARSQQTYKIIIMVPIGVLVILILRILIGIPTIGTFMPVLISLAFKDTTLIWGIILFTLIVIVGFSFRSYFESLKILVVPRLGMLLCVVILSMCVISILANKLSVQQGLSITLFPMVILTMTIERLSILWEERGAQEALTNALGSLFSAIVIYFFIFNSTLEYIFLNFPTLILVVMASMLLIGKYHGYRLSELIRFKAFSQIKE